MPQWAADDANYNYIAAYAAMVPAQKVTDVTSMAGSATTTSTVIVSDGSKTYTVTRDDLWDSSQDVGYTAASDLTMMLYKLTANTQGIAPAQIQSVDFKTTVTAQRKTARIVGVSVPGGLKPGKNTVQTVLAAYGTHTLQVANTTLVIPPGTPTNGVLRVTAPRNNQDDMFFFRDARRARFTDNRKTVAQIVAGIEAMPQNNDLLLTYQPRSFRPVGPVRDAGSSKKPVKATGHSDWVTKGGVSLRTGMVFLRAMPTTAAYNGSVLLGGVVPSAHGKSNVEIYQRATGASSFGLVATVPVTVKHGFGIFHYRVSKMTLNTTFKAVWDGDDRSLGATATRSVQVRARLTLAAQPAHVQPGGHVTLIATLKPLQPGATVWFDRLVGGKWRPIKAVRVAASGDASLSWAPPSGTSTVRARFAGNAMNAPTISAKAVVKAD
jgi:hypothetical protein